ncbi:MAG: hypothetical protein AVDCRST_MAG25-3133, partial [uncultured Rubrobacteraceae bacterium]
WPRAQRTTRRKTAVSSATSRWGT